MDLMTSLLTYALALGIAVAIPGPGIAALVGQAMGGNFRAALAFILGVTFGDLVFMTVAVAGLSALAKTFAGAFMVVKILGGVYLTYLAYKFWTADSGPTDVTKAKNRSNLRAVIAGFSITLSNPKAIVFYMALLPTVLDLKAIGPQEWVMMAVTTFVVLFAVLIPYAILANRARHLMARSGALTQMYRGAAVFIGGAGLFMLTEVIYSLRRTA